ncbi:MAG: ACP S-malonyltransferase [Candidatus Krumholzibacteriia bacterium]
MHRLPMLFPGQASQAVGMAADLAARPGPGADFLASVDDILGFALTRIMWEGPAETLVETRHAQPAIFAHSVAVLLELRARGVEPSAVAGHSLGEYAAAVAAGSLDPADGLRLVRRRGELMFAAGRERPGAMAAVLGLPVARVAAVCAEVGREVGVVVVANHNSADQVAISGETAAVEAAGPRLTAAGAKRVIPLAVSGAFHSPLLAGAAALFAAELQAVALAEPRVPLYANVSAQPVTTAAALRDGLARQLTAPVLWHDSLAAMVAAAPVGGTGRLFLEVGPGQVLSNLARRGWREARFLPVGTAADLDKILDSVAAALT